MKKYFKLATLIIVLCLCFAVTAFGNISKEKTLAKQQVNIQKKTNQMISANLEQKDVKRKEAENYCKSTLKNLGTACEMYAADHKGYYPQNLDILIKDIYHNRISPKCPIGNTNYIFISKQKQYYYILKCPTCDFLFDSEATCFNLSDSGDYYFENLSRAYYRQIMTGSINTRYGTVHFTPEELKKLETKNIKEGL